MREGYISFWEPILLREYLYFTLTRGAAKNKKFETLVQRSQIMVYLRKGSAEDVIIFCSDKDEFGCVIKDDGTLLIKWASPISFRTNNDMMRHGVLLRADEFVIEARLKDIDCYGLYTAEGVKDLRDNAYSIETARKNVAILQETLRAHAVDAAPDGDEEEPYQPHKILERRLNLAENYANLESDLAAQAAQENRLAYHRIEPSDYERKDRTAYVFITSELQEQNYRVGAQVEVEGEDDLPYTAEIISAEQGEEDGEARLGLLFNGQIGLEKLNEAGWISLSFSTVVRDVQLESIEKIRTGKAAAKYMDTVLGEKRSGGFSNIDLTAVEEALNAREYPPTPSQMRAIRNGIRSKDIYLVMGPPGTGKTTVILEWVKYFVQQGKRVLVSSQNNKAVDNVLARLAEEKEIDVIRIGSEAKVEMEVRRYLFENKIANTRREIAEKTAENIAIADAMLTKWKAVHTQLSSYAKELVRYEEEEKQLMGTLIPQLIASGNDVQEKYKEYISARNTAAHLRQSLQQRYDRMMSYPTEGLAGLWGRFRRWFDQGAMKKEVQAYDHARARELAAAAPYNEVRRQYTLRYQEVRDSVYVPLQSLKDICTRNHALLQTLTEDARGLNSCAWNFFASSFPTEMCSSDVIPYEVAIAGDLGRFESFIKHLKDWQQKNENKQDYSLKHMILESVDLVGATCIGVSSQKRFADLKFDVTIIDEAGQIQIHNALVPMSVSNKLIMLGDHRQIPPSVDQSLVNACDENGVKTELLEKSLFEQLYEDLPESNKMMLDTQFRMPPEIAAIISHEFYEGEYHSLPDWKKNLVSLFPQLSSARMVVIDTAQAPARMEEKSEGGGTYNVLEAEIIARIVRGLQEQPAFDLHELGVISAYKAQVKKIRGMLSDCLTEDERQEMAATLDSFQGQERDIIIYSFTRSSQKPPHLRRIGFLNELRRLNVAMTRCKKMLILVGDMDFLSRCMHEAPDEDGNLTAETYVGSERHFSAFIQDMLRGVQSGVDGWPAGEIISYDEFNRRMEGIEDGGR